MEKRSDRQEGFVEYSEPLEIAKKLEEQKLRLKNALQEIKDIISAKERIKEIIERNQALNKEEKIELRMKVKEIDSRFRDINEESSSIKEGEKNMKNIEKSALRYKKLHQEMLEILEELSTDIKH